MDQEQRLALIRSGAPERDRAATRKLAREGREGRTGQLPTLPAGARQTAPRALSEREQLLADGFAFSVAQADQERAAGEHWGRRRRADRERATRQAMHDALRGSIREAWNGGDDTA
ncbi:hypothetical protein AB0O67_24355 [Streptomyces sp. NPDC086077]|uniref:hypothetical protein n=1 Tax=Streptomyces sp. NPDC086077 TaxID=3154862 RepID=UPI0034401EF6